MTEPAPNEPAAERVRVAVVFGGRSSEHSISCVSAGSVLRALDRDRYDVVPVGITQDGRWVLAPDDPDRLAISDGRLPTVPSGSEVALSADPTAPGLQVRAAGDVPVELHAVDVVFPVLHGPGARTAPSRACSSWRGCRTSGPASSRRRRPWTRGA